MCEPPRVQMQCRTIGKANRNRIGHTKSLFSHLGEEAFICSDNLRHLKRSRLNLF